MRQNDERVKYVVMILHAENLIIFYSDVTKELTVKQENAISKPGINANNTKPAIGERKQRRCGSCSACTRND